MSESSAGGADIVAPDAHLAVRLSLEERDAALAREFAEEEAARADAAVARRLAEEDKGDAAARKAAREPPRGGAAVATALPVARRPVAVVARRAQPVGRLIVAVHCVADLADCPEPFFFTEFSLYVVATVHDRSGNLVAEFATEASVVDLEGRRVAWQSRSAVAVFNLPEAALECATLTLTLYAEPDLDCCVEEFAAVSTSEPPKAFGRTAALPISTASGHAADWCDGNPRDHHLDNGAVMTASTRLRARPFDPPLATAAAAAALPATGDDDAPLLRATPTVNATPVI